MNKLHVCTQVNSLIAEKTDKKEKKQNELPKQISLKAIKILAASFVIQTLYRLYVAVLVTKFKRRQWLLERRK